MLQKHSWDRFYFCGSISTLPPSTLPPVPKLSHVKMEVLNSHHFAKKKVGKKCRKMSLPQFTAVYSERRLDATGLSIYLSLKNNLRLYANCRERDCSPDTFWRIYYIFLFLNNTEIASILYEKEFVPPCEHYFSLFSPSVAPQTHLPTFHVLFRAYFMSITLAGSFWMRMI